MTDQAKTRSTADWLVDLCVYAPIGFALDAHKYVPEFADRGRNQVALARFLGKFALERLEKQLGPLGAVFRTSGSHEADAASPPPTAAAASTGSTPAGSEPLAFEPVASEPASAEAAAPSASAAAAAGSLTNGSAGAPSRAPSASPGPSGARPAGERPPRAKASRNPAGAATVDGTAASRNAAPRTTAPARPSPAKGRAKAKAKATSPTGTAPREHKAQPTESSLAIEGYTTLAASQIVPRLTTLARAELEAIGNFERANRSRRTILHRVEQLLSER